MSNISELMTLSNDDMEKIALINDFILNYDDPIYDDPDDITLTYDDLVRNYQKSADKRYVTLIAMLSDHFSYLLKSANMKKYYKKTLF